MAAEPAGRRILATLLVAVCLVATGCGRDTSPTPVPPLPPASADALQPSMPVGMSPTPGRELDDTHALVSMPWKLAAISADRRTITVQYVGGDGYCVKHEGYRLTHDGTDLELGEYSSSTGDATCPASLQLGLETVPLPVALDGAVQLIHVPASGEWTRYLE